MPAPLPIPGTINGRVVMLAGAGARRISGRPLDLRAHTESEPVRGRGTVRPRDPSPPRTMLLPNRGELERWEHRLDLGSTWFEERR
jgi:hypothetical protein